MPNGVSQLYREDTIRFHLCKVLKLVKLPELKGRTGTVESMRNRKGELIISGSSFN